MEESPYIRDKVSARTAPSSLGQDRPCGGCGDPHVHSPPQGGARALEAPPGRPQSQSCTDLPSTGAEETSSLPEALRDVTLGDRNSVPKKVPLSAHMPPLLSSPGQGVAAGPALLNTRGCGDLCAPPLLQFLSPRGDRNKRNVWFRKEGMVVLTDMLPMRPWQ